MKYFRFLVCVCALPLLLSANTELAFPKKALIFGVSGQDGSYLAEFLLSKNYEVHGVKRRASSFNTSRIDHIYQDFHNANTRFFLHYGDLEDAGVITRLIEEIQPDEIYNLAAQSHVKVSFEMPEFTADVTGLGTLRILEALRLLGLEKKVRFYQASSSEMYGKVVEIPQKETTPFYPRSPYGVSKVFSYWITVNYRESYGMYACNGILFNHESPRRGETFVTRKITRGASRIKYGLDDILYIGNLDACRDWGYAKDYVEAMWQILQQEKPDDYVIGMGETHSVREFAILAFKEAGFDLAWRGEGLDEEGYDQSTGRVLIKIDPRYFRPAEVEYLISDISKAKEKFGWKPRHSFQELIQIMMEYDLEEASKEKEILAIRNR